MQHFLIGNNLLFSSMYNICRQFVRLGEHDLSTVDDCLSIGICQTYEEFGIDPKQKPLIHPDYDNVNKYKDVALIKLDNAIAFQGRYTYICC